MRFRETLDSQVRPLTLFRNKLCNGIYPAARLHLGDSEDTGKWNQQYITFLMASRKNLCIFFYFIFGNNTQALIEN